VHVLEEALQVLLDEAVENSFFGAALSVCSRFVCGHGARASATAMPAGRFWISPALPSPRPWLRAPSSAVASPGARHGGIANSAPPPLAPLAGASARSA
jgi:hypothetical protein